MFHASRVVPPPVADSIADKKVPSKDALAFFAACAPINAKHPLDSRSIVYNISMHPEDGLIYNSSDTKILQSGIKWVFVLILIRVYFVDDHQPSVRISLQLLNISSYMRVLG